MRIRIKICGITRPEDALTAATLGADAIGLIFYHDSPRLVTIEQAQAIVAALPPFVNAVGVFVDAGNDEIRTICEQVPLDLIQFHGDETPDQCRGPGVPYIKVIRVREGLDITGYAGRYPDARGFLLDTYQEGIPGGTGNRFDWSFVPADLKRPIILAGGLTVDNVAGAIDTLRPYGVDVSGGVEASSGIKDPDKMAAFIDSVRSASRT